MNPLRDLSQSLRRPLARAFSLSVSAWMPKAISNNQQKKARKLAVAVGAARDAFIKYFENDQFGARIGNLVAALEKRSLPTAMVNRYCDPKAIAAYLQSNSGPERVPGLTFQCYTRVNGHRFTPATADTSGMLAAYHIDAASLLAVQALAPAPNARCLDMCAAPGGKTLALAQLLGLAGSITANDVSAGRRQRLQDTLGLYLPRKASRRGAVDASAAIADDASDDSAKPTSKHASSAPSPAGPWVPPAPPSVQRKSMPAPPTVRVIGRDGTAPAAFGSCAYDCVLLDAPCSSERHVLADEGELVQWGPGRIKANAARQRLLLRSALEACVDGGTVVYSTCALSRKENDEVVLKTLQRAPFPVLIVPLKFAFGEPTPIGGWHVLPDTATLPSAGANGGFGPLYICKMVKGVDAVPMVKGVDAVPSGLRGDYTVTNA